MYVLPYPKPINAIHLSLIVQSFVDGKNNGLDGVIPRSVLQQAKGFAIFTVAKAGFLFSARAGSGVVIARLDDGSKLLQKIVSNFSVIYFPSRVVCSQCYWHGRCWVWWSGRCRSDGFPRGLKHSCCEFSLHRRLRTFDLLSSLSGYRKRVHRTRFYVSDGHNFLEIFHDCWLFDSGRKPEYRPRSARKERRGHWITKLRGKGRCYV